MKTNTYRLAASLALALAMAPLAAKADYPEKPIAIVVGYAAGGGTDILARTVAPYVEKYLGGNAKLVIKNVPGAGGQIGFTPRWRAPRRTATPSEPSTCRPRRR